MPNNPSREAFEQKFAPLGYTFGIDETDGEYLFADTHHAWLGWQAGAQAEREKLLPVATIIKGTEVTERGTLINKREIDWYPEDIENLPIGTQLFVRDRSAP